MATANDATDILAVLEEVAPEVPVALDTDDRREKMKTIIIGNQQLSHQHQARQKRLAVSALWHRERRQPELTGIARLHRLRTDLKLAGASAVWPFETGWAAKAKWLPAHVLVLHAEIYPSVRNPLPDEIKDRGQVRAMWQWARDLDHDNLLWREFCRPIEVETGSKEDLAIQLTEGWILGCSPTITNQ